MDDLTRLALAGGDGDRAALEQFVRLAQPLVWRYCVHAADAGTAEDRTQETFVRALGSLHRFRGQSTARTWLLTIAHRTCVDAVRRNMRHRALLSRLRLATVEEPVPDRTDAIELDEHVRRLDPDRRAAFVLTQVLGFSYEETAQVCRCPIGTVRSRVARARMDLLAAVGDHGSDVSGTGQAGDLTP